MNFIVVEYVETMKNVFCSLFFAFTLLLSIPANAEPLRLVTFDNPPYAFEENGKVKGSIADVLQEAFQRMNKEISISIVPWKRALQMVRYGEADAVFRAAKNEERIKYMFYPDETTDTAQCVAYVVVGKTVAVDSEMRDVQNIRAGIGLGFSYGDTFDKKLISASFKKIDKAVTVEKGLEKLFADRTDVFFVAKAVGDYILSQKEFRVDITTLRNNQGEEIVYSAAKNYLAFSRKTMTKEIVEQFSDVLRTMKDDGTYVRIAAQYY